MALDFTKKSCSELYNDLCTEAKKDLEDTRAQIKRYFCGEDKKEELSLYKEKIFTGKLRSEQIDSSILGFASTIFIPTVVSTLIAIVTLIVQAVNGNVNLETIPVYIASIITILFTTRIAWIRRSNSKSEKEWISTRRVLYFLEHYEIK